MSNLIERYVQQVGRFLPAGDRAEVEAELRSLIYDRLDDRFGGAPTPEETAAVLAELGSPSKMAASYGGERYLVGPELYPHLMMVLRYSWMIVPSVVAFIGIFSALVSAEITLQNLIVEPVLSAVQAVFFVSASVVLIFALLQRADIASAAEKTFDPNTLPETDDPRTIDRVETAFGIVLGVLTTTLLVHCLRMGGLALPFGLSTGDPIPAPAAWLIVLALACIGMLVLHVYLLRRQRWSIGLWIAETALELIGAVSGYFAILEPVFGKVGASIPELDALPLAQIIAIVTAVLMLIGRGARLVRLWNYGSADTSQFAARSAK